MNVSDALKKFLGNEIYTAAYLMNQKAVEQIETVYQEAWDSGNGFTFATMFSPRKDDESEMKACAVQMQNDLKKLIVKEWISKYTRDEMIALCNLLLKGPQNRYTRICLVADLERTADDIAIEWNGAHPNESPIYFPDPDIG